MSQAKKIQKLRDFTKSVYMVEVSDLRLSFEERSEVLSQRHDYTVIMNAKRTIAHILLRSFGAESHLRMKFHPSFFRTSSTTNMLDFFKLKLGYGI